jgi:phosphohistidine swiveling domain-containing protein
MTQQGWYFGNKEGIESLLNKKFISEIPMVLYYNDGPLEIWDDEQVIEKIQREVVNKNKEDINFCKEAMIYFDKVIKCFFESKWKKEFTKDKDELRESALKFSEMCPYYVFIYYSLLTKSAPEKYKKDVELWKERDIFFENNGRFIEKSLEAIYPTLKHFINYIKIDEIENPPAKNILEQRKKHYILIPNFFDEAVSYEDFFKNHKNFVFIKEEVIKTDTLRGQPANGGKVSGKVRLLKSRENMEEVLEGEIIVSPMTTPEFLPAMKKAAAFVTDEGGLLSHAAIVARELKKPCVVGTKIATQVLKDGDFVEVDADSGIVKIIK